MRQTHISCKHHLAFVHWIAVDVVVDCFDDVIICHPSLSLILSDMLLSSPELIFFVMHKLFKGCFVDAALVLLDLLSQSLSFLLVSFKVS